MNARKALSFLLAAAMAGSLAACGETSSSTSVPTSSAGKVVSTASSTVSDTTSDITSSTTTAPAGENDTRKAADVFPTLYNAEQYEEDSERIYNEVLGDFLVSYKHALEEDDINERYTWMAVAEGQLLASAVMIPLQSRNSNYAVSRVAPKTVNSTLWGKDNERYHQAVVVDSRDFLTKDQVSEIRTNWEKLRGTGMFEEWVKKYLAEEGYKLSDAYNIPYYSVPDLWDILSIEDSEVLMQTYEGLYEYDIENVQQPALAISYEVSEDGKIYTFKLREGVVWVDSQGRKVADVKADDFVAGMQHMLDVKGGSEYLVGAYGCGLAGAQDYMDGRIDDFSKVGVRALDDHTLEYTLDAPCPFFMSLLGYGAFAPMSREYYISQGGRFGAEYDDEAESYVYGMDPDHIAYNGPFLVTEMSPENNLVFKANDNYWNKDSINIHKMTWYYREQMDEQKNYDDAKAGTIVGTGLSSSFAEQRENDGIFEEHAYVVTTENSSVMGFFNLNRMAYANFNDKQAAVSDKTMEQANRARTAMLNKHFRRALTYSLDRGTYNAQLIGEDLKYTNLINTYVPGKFVQLTEKVQIDYNGEKLTFPKDTYYGEIVQTILTAEGVEATVWMPKMEGGSGSSSGYDGWYNPEAAAKEVEQAVEELAAQGVEISKENPICLDIPTFTGNEKYANRAGAFKKSVETATGRLVRINIVECETSDDWLYAGFYYGAGNEANFDICDISSWAPEYGDPKTYLETMLPDYDGYMVKALGIF